MAFYRDSTNVNRTGDEYAEKYNKEWKPGQNPKFPGIYKCQSCGYEDVINRECETMPPCAECQEDTTTWKLLVRAMDKAES